jgi:pyruvate formate lyase activating enzyme
MSAEAKPIYGITPFTMLDFPQRTACIIWFAGCNMRCGYCHNPEIVRSKGNYPANHALDFLKKRQGILDGVVFSGGEATLSPALPDLARAARTMGYAIKLDTNGTRPHVIEQLLSENLLDYVALDYKAPQEKWRALTRCGDFSAFSETLDILCTQTHVPFEVRTTVHTDLLDERDTNNIIGDLDRRDYKGTYFVQNVFAAGARPTLGNVPPQSRLLAINTLDIHAGHNVAMRNF